MILTRRSTAWLLAGLQWALALCFTWYLCQTAGVGISEMSQGPGHLSVMAFLLFGLAILLSLFALWKFEFTAILLIAAIHTVCPILFFTDLTRNPYFTQIVLLNIWVGFFWIGWAWECWQNGKILFPRTPLDVPILAFLLICLVSFGASLFTHTDFFRPAIFSEGLKAWMFVTVNAVAVFYIGVLSDEKWRKRFIWLTFWVGGLAAVYGLMQFYGIEQIWQSSLTPFANRPVSTFGNPNFLSSYLMMLVPLLVVSLIIEKNKFSGFLTFFFLVMMVTGIIATMTRSTWVGLLLSLVLLPLLPSVRDYIRKHARRFGLIALILGLSVVFWPKSKMGGYASPLQRIMEIKQIKTSGEYGPWHQRLLIWSSCWTMAKDHPVIGKGWGTLELFYPYYQGRALFIPIFRNFRTHANNAHNEMIEVWSQTGFIGMGIFVWLWVVLVGFGIRCAKYYHDTAPERSLWAWGLTVAALGMFADNFMGNVSIHFAVPGFLFWWQAGLLFSVGRGSEPGKNVLSEWYLRPLDNNLYKGILSLLILFMAASSIWQFRREFQEIYYFKGFKVSKTSDVQENARKELEAGWLWYPREVNMNYELSNTYARLAQQTERAGLVSQTAQWRRKAVWGYMESLRSNAGYDEIFFNLAALETQLGWRTDDFSDIEVETPRGLKRTETANNMHGAIFNYTRSIAINPLSKDAYGYLGTVYLQDREKYRSEAILMFRQAVTFFPKERDFHINLAILQMEAKQFDEALAAIRAALEIDPFNEHTRGDMRVILANAKRPNDPLAEADRLITEVQPLIQNRDWSRLKNVAERLEQILPGSFQVRFLLANTYFSMQDLKKAEAAYQKALELSPNDVSALYNYGVACRMLNKIPEAKAAFKKAVSVNPGHAPSQGQLKELEGK